jgi:hypothetical protein
MWSFLTEKAMFMKQSHPFPSAAVGSLKTNLFATARIKEILTLKFGFLKQNKLKGAVSLMETA